jgi:hypothetical protein
MKYSKGIPFPFINEMSLQGSWLMSDLKKHHKKYDYKKYELKNKEHLYDEGYMEQ